MNRPKTPLAVRFFRKVRVPSADLAACWEWTASTVRGGYGKIIAGGRGSRWLRAHRVAWELANGPIPAGMIVRHCCDNPSCVRPSHLEIGTVADNQRDMAARRRGAHSRVGLPYGVCRNGQKWQVRPRIDGQTRYLGTFDTIEEAAAVAQQEHERLYG